jgi:hypothetical protein
MSDALTLLLAASLRVTAVLAAAWLITLPSRRSSASARHMVWTCAIGAAVITPVLLQLPGWQVPIPETLPRWSRSSDAVPTVDKRPGAEPASNAPATLDASTPASNIPEPVGPSPATYIGAMWACCSMCSWAWP